tara:strand:- start:1475 stop:1966 length:492 start_codon:yes stop_codon:yes gene_type:complete
MSKRSRNDFDGPTQILKRHCLLQIPEPRGFKRSREEVDDNLSSKKTRTRTTEVTPSLKRGAGSIEENISKRMRYSKPSVEEAIAFLLPHIQELRHLYNNEVELNSAKSAHILDTHNLLQQEISAKQRVMSNNKTILTAYHKVMAENNQLKRELDLMRYRLNLM